MDGGEVYRAPGAGGAGLRHESSRRQCPCLSRHRAANDRWHAVPHLRRSPDWKILVSQDKWTVLSPIHYSQDSSRQFRPISTAFSQPRDTRHGAVERGKTYVVSSRQYCNSQRTTSQLSEDIVTVRRDHTVEYNIRQCFK